MRAIGNLLVAATIVDFFVLACVGSAGRGGMTTGLDEPAHASYVAQIQKTGDVGQDLRRLRLIDPHTFEFTAEPNYLNHPPFFYALLAALGPKLEGHPQALRADRLFDVALVAAGLAALLALGLTAPFSRADFYAYTMPLVDSDPGAACRYGDQRRSGLLRRPRWRRSACGNWWPPAAGSGSLGR
jgi:hypothetical protein